MNNTNFSVLKHISTILLPPRSPVWQLVIHYDPRPSQRQRSKRPAKAKSTTSTLKKDKIKTRVGKPNSENIGYQVAIIRYMGEIIVFLSFST